MKDCMGSIYSFLDSTTIQKTNHTTVARHTGHRINTYDQLVDAVAKLSFCNPYLNLFFRGQTHDYKIRCKNEDETSLLPGIFRKEVSPDKETSRRYLEDTLPKKTAAIMAEMQRLHPKKSDPYRLLVASMEHFNETQWAILQHYGCPTPLLDVTQSLQVACWFATHEDASDTFSEDGYVYVLGLPDMHGHISFFVQDSIVMIRLQSACPPEAKRPHCQEGYLVGSIPHTPQPYTFRPRDMALRLVAKFQITNTEELWASVGNSRLKKATLFPQDDPIKSIVDQIREEHR